MVGYLSQFLQLLQIILYILDITTLKGLWIILRVCDNERHQIASSNENSDHLTGSQKTPKKQNKKKSNKKQNKNKNKDKDKTKKKTAAKTTKKQKN